jgi:hypothetical protein
MSTSQVTFATDMSEPTLFGKTADDEDGGKKKHEDKDKDCLCGRKHRFEKCLFPTSLRLQASSTQEPKSSKRKKGRKGPTDRSPTDGPPNGPADGATAVDGALDIDGNDDDESRSDLVLMYNTVRSCHQRALGTPGIPGVHSASRPQKVAMTALKTSIARGEHQRRRDEFTDRGLATIRDGYTASQIPDLTRKVWQQSLGEGCVSQQFRTQLCFLFGNSMLLRLGNRLPMELPDLFSMPLPKGQRKMAGALFPPWTKVWISTLLTAKVKDR